MKNYKLIAQFVRHTPTNQEYLAFKQKCKEENTVDSLFELTLLDIAECIYGKTIQEETDIIDAFGGISGHQYNYIKGIIQRYF